MQESGGATSAYNKNQQERSSTPKNLFNSKRPSTQGSRKGSTQYSAINEERKEQEVSEFDKVHNEESLASNQRKANTEQDDVQSNSNVTEPSWAMFEKIKELGVGSFGVVYLVRFTQNSLIRGDADNLQASTQSAVKPGNVKKSAGSFLQGVGIVPGVSTRAQAIQNRNQIMKELIKDQLYVIKVIETKNFPEEIGLAMMEEIELMQTLESPYVVGYVNSFIDLDYTINIILEYCPGSDLQTHIVKSVAANPQKKGMVFHENIVWKMFIQICLGIHYLHSQKGILHRDLKALNIFLTKDNDAKIGDFGAAQKIQDCVPVKIMSRDDPIHLQRIIEESKEDNQKYEDTMLFSLSASNTIKRDYKNRKVGTPFYLAPELWETETNNLCSKQSDIWSLGVILYELCTQKKPFMANDPVALKNKVLKEKYTAIPLVVPQIFQDIIARCLQKKANKRPTIDEIISMDVFQQKSKMHKIKLPSLHTNQAAPSTNASDAKPTKALVMKKPAMIEDPQSTMLIQQSDVKKNAQSSVKNQSEAGPKTPFQASSRKAAGDHISDQIKSNFKNLGPSFAKEDHQQISPHNRSGKKTDRTNKPSTIANFQIILKNDPADHEEKKVESIQEHDLSEDDEKTVYTQNSNVNSASPPQRRLIQKKMPVAHGDKQQPGRSSNVSTNKEQRNISNNNDENPFAQPAKKERQAGAQISRTSMGSFVGGNAQTVRKSLPELEKQPSTDHKYKQAESLIQKLNAGEKSGVEKKLINDFENDNPFKASSNVKDVLEEQSAQPKPKPTVAESYLKKPTVISTKASMIESKIKPTHPTSKNKANPKTNKLHKDFSQKSLASAASSKKGTKPENLKNLYGGFNIKIDEVESLQDDPPMTAKHHNRVNTGNFNNQQHHQRTDQKKPSADIASQTYKKHQTSVQSAKDSSSMIIPSGGHYGKLNRMSTNLKGSAIAGSRGLKKKKLTDKVPERIDTESNQMEFEEDSNNQQRNLLDDMLLTEGTNPNMDDSDNEEKKEEPFFYQLEDCQEVILPSAEDNLKDQDDPIQVNLLAASEQDQYEEENLLNDLENEQMRIDLDEMMLNTKKAASRNSRKLTDYDDKKHFATDTNNKLDDMF